MRYDRAAVKRALILCLLVVPCLASAADEVIPWTEAANCVGRTCAVSGTVAEVENDGPAIRLYFDPKRRDVCVTLVRAWLVSWPDYAGRSIVARGFVRRFHEVTEVTVRDPGGIALSGPAPEPTPPIAFEAPAKEEVQDLRKEIDRLEKRVKELESR